MSKPHLHIHSDCPFFAGCENMLVNFFASEEMHNRFKITFSYRFTEAYENGLRQRVHNSLPMTPLRLYEISECSTTQFGSLIETLIRLLRVIFFLKWWFLLWNTLVLFRLFRQDSIDILHINNGGFPGSTSCFSAAFAASLAGVRHISMTVNNMAVPYDRWQRLVDYPFDRLLILLGVHFITGSQHAGEHLAKILKLPSTKLTNFPNGIQPRAITETVDQVYTRLQIPCHRCVLGIIANLEIRKGHHVLLEAIATIKQRLPRKQWPLFVFEGQGSEEDNLRSMVAELDIADLVKFVGVENQVFNLIAALDVLILPSVSHEDFPNVILEAMMLSKPVIATNIAGIPEQVVEGETGLLVPPNDSDALAKEVIFMVKNPRIRQQMGIAAKNLFHGRFFWKVAVARYLIFFQSLLAEDNL